MRGDEENSGHATERKRAEQQRVGAGDEHHHEHGRANQRRCSQVHLRDDQGKEHGDDRARHHEAMQPARAPLFIARKPPGEKKNRRDLPEL